MKKRVKKTVSLFLALAMLATVLTVSVSAANETRDSFTLTGGSVEVNGTEDKEVNIVFSSAVNLQLLGIQGECEIAPADGIELTAFDVAWTVSTLNPANVFNGKFVYADDVYFVGFASAQNAPIVTATYTVDKDTPSGTYDVDLYLVEYLNEDFMETWAGIVTNQTYTTTITVTNTSSDEPGPVAPAKEYTVSIAPADTVDVNNVRVGDTVDMDVTVTGAAFNGVEAVVTYDTTVFSSADDTDANGEIKISELYNSAKSDGSTVKTLTFTAIAAGTGEFGFKSATAGDFDDFSAKAAVPASTSGTSVTVLAVYPVTIGDIENGSASADKTTAIEGENVTVTVTPDEGYIIDSVAVADDAGIPVTATENADGTYTFAMPASGVTVTVTIVEEPEILVETYENYVTGYTLVTVSGSEAAYTYDGNAMYYLEASGVHAWLVAGAADETKVAVGTATAGTIAAGTYDINASNTVDFFDAGCAFACYNLAYTVETNMATYLRADVNGSHNVDADDVNAILAAY